jgi:flagellar biosynthesis/type III secretory pathway chaperone
VARASALIRIVAELDQELALYRVLAALLDEQYRSAVNADGRSLKWLCAMIAQKLELLEARRRMRDPNLLGIAALFSGDDRGAGDSEPALRLRCRELKRLALLCKSMCLRNGQMLALHYECLQHALHGEVHTYDPG